MAEAQKITVPRPKPDELVLAAVDADGAQCWVTFRKDLIPDSDMIRQFAEIMEDGQRLVHERGGEAFLVTGSGRSADPAGDGPAPVALA